MGDVIFGKMRQKFGLNQLFVASATLCRNKLRKKDADYLESAQKVHTFALAKVFDSYALI